MKLNIIIAFIISTLAIQHTSHASGTSNRNKAIAGTAAVVGVAAVVGSLFGKSASNNQNKEQPAQQNNAQPAFAKIPKESEKSVDKLVQALQGREFKCRTAEIGLVLIHFNSGMGMIRVGKEEKLATTNAKMGKELYRWYTPEYDKQYTVINEGGVWASKRNGKVFRGPAIIVNTGSELTNLQCVKVAANTLFDPLPAEETVAAPEKDKPKEKSGLSKMWKSIKGSTKNSASTSNESQSENEIK